MVDTYCVAEYHDEWDLSGLHADMLTFWPSGLTMEQLGDATSKKELTEALLDDGVRHYEAREVELGADVLRQVERQVMLRIIDTRWREHLFEMDYLQEGINLRAMGQRDPLTEWQREGYEMFGQMMQGIAQDLVRYVMHVQVSVSEPAKAQVEAAAAKAAAEAEAERVAAELADAPKESVDWGDSEVDEEGEASDATPEVVTDEVVTDEVVTEGDATDQVGTDESEPGDAVGAEPTAADDDAVTAEVTAEGTETPDEAAEAGPEADEALEAAADAEQEPEPEPEPEREIVVELSEELLARIGGSEADVQIMGYSAPEDPAGGGGMSATAATDTGAVPGTSADPETMTPIRKTEWEKTARNAPCPCGSGKKYKRCHGAAA